MSTMTRGACARPVTIRPVRVVEPPALDEQSVGRLFEEARGRAVRPRTLPAYVQGSLAVDFRTKDEDPQFGPQATLRQDLPEPAAWTRQLLHAVLECAGGSRSPQQVGRWTTPEIRARLTRRHTVAQRRGRVVERPQVRRLRVTEPVDGVVEAAAVVVLGGRVRAVALRLNGADGRWLMTELDLG